MVVLRNRLFVVITELTEETSSLPPFVLVTYIYSDHHKRQNFPSIPQLG